MEVAMNRRSAEKVFSYLASANAFWPMMALSFLGGGLMSLRHGVDMQVAVEVAQVWAGKISYPPDNVFGMYQMSAVSLIHVPLALLMKMGVSEWTLSVGLAMAMGGLSFMALSSMAWAFTRHAFFAWVVPFLILAGGVTAFHVTYPVTLMGGPHTYGILGLSGSVLVTSLLAGGHLRSGFVAMALFPAFHPSMAMWSYLIWIPALLFHKPLWSGFKTFFLYFLIPIALTGVYLLWAMVMKNGPSQVDMAVVRPALEAWCRWYDGHRAAIQPPTVHFFQSMLGMGEGVNALDRAWFLAVALPLSLVLVLLALRRQGGSPGGSFSLHWLLMGFCFLFLVLVPLTHVDPKHLPTWFLIGMPSRMVNVLIMTAPVVWLATPFLLPIGWVRSILILSGFLLFLPTAMGNLPGLSGMESLSGETVRLHHLDLPRFLLAVTSPILILLGFFKNPSTTSHPKWLGYARVSGMVFVGVVCGWVLVSGVSGATQLQKGPRIRTDHKKAPVLINFDNAYLNLQVQTGERVFFNAPSWDQFPMIFPAIPQSLSILRDIYGIDLLKSPLEQDRLGLGHLVVESVNDRWSNRSPEEWKELRSRYGFGEILCGFPLKVTNTGH